ncbi:hypothetical protein ACFOLF_37235 [Paenibacillus sepulcri]|uniref:DUF4879 domain-containing protein n=1 Tax=Paenibacillus sepulcri TaxID=359917 RepID=A0ABS7C652_9BACL|nr:hypothetical protein [Paenibacillus sepulcri]
MKPMTYLVTFLSSFLVLVSFWMMPSANAEPNGQPVAPSVQISQSKGTVGAAIHFSSEGLKQNVPVKLLWETEQGSYDIKGLYSFIGPVYKPEVNTILTGMSDEQGKWQGSFIIPRGFGGDHTIWYGNHGTSRGNQLFDHGKQLAIVIRQQDDGLNLRGIHEWQRDR